MDKERLRATICKMEFLLGTLREELFLMNWKVLSQKNLHIQMFPSMITMKCSTMLSNGLF